MKTRREMLLRRVVRRLVDRKNFRPTNRLEDRGGMHCMVMKKGGEQFYVVAKEEMWDDEASLLRKTVQRAADHGSVIVCWFDDPGEYYVFDAEWVRKNGHHKRTKSKTHVTDWLVVPVHTGVTLDDYLLGRDRPSRVQNTEVTTFRRFEE